MIATVRSTSPLRATLRLIGVASLGLVAPLFAFANSVFEHPVTADELLRGILAQPAKLVEAAQVIRGEFVFKRFLSELPAPLESTGEYVFVKGLGIDWHTLEPLDSESIVTATGTTQRDDGKVTMQSDASAQPAVRTVTRILTSLLTLDVRALKSTFDLFGEDANGHWEIGLRPIVPAVAAIIRDATVSGSEQVERVTLHDVNGDRAEIVFQRVTYDASTPTEQDRLRLVQ